MNERYIGLNSGTSMDGIDAALVEFGDRSLTVIRTRRQAYPDDVREALRAAIASPHDCDVDCLGALHRRIGEAFRDAALALIAETGAEPGTVAAIGSHGQTLRHQPDAEQPFTLQIGDAAIIAVGTGIPTVGDFRSADLALGGQGAPLVPAFHEWLFRAPGISRVVVNIGGIANLTVLPAGEEPVTGYDTGPGNALLDAWIREQRDEPYDSDGAWSASGTADTGLLEHMLADPFFHKAPPKSTGLEYFNLPWLRRLGIDGLAPADVQATLCALTAASIAAGIRASPFADGELLVCGGGARNGDLLRRLAANLPGWRVTSTAAAGLDPDWVEAAAFAWLAMRRLQGLPGNLPQVTGASRPAVLGAVHAPV
jgi:anhydro-N-acetylmuramic acid kinase